MTRITLVAIAIMTAMAMVGGFLIVTSANYNGGSIIIQNSKSGQFQTGLALLTIGLLGIALVAWFTAVTGKSSIFRRRPRPGWPSPPR